MPAFPSTTLLESLVNHTVTNSSSITAATNNTKDALKVICAWPVSGQYGPGSRVLYYVLVATCVFARKEEWLRGACLAAALLFPAVAAIHGIVLATVRINGAVDMDVYGAFQLCAIGILAAPVTVTLSQTYFNSRGRNTIFLWTGLILAGLLSLTVEFYRINTSHCTRGSFDKPLSFAMIDSLNTENFTCGLICSTQQGPFSPLRGGSANNIYVIPAPDQLSFGTSTLLAAACCVPAILSLLHMWSKIYETHSKRSSDSEGEDKCHHCLCHRYRPVNRGHNDIASKMSGLTRIIRLSLNHVQMIVLSGAVLTILCIGEMNFFSTQVRYQTEPMASIGQWAPMVGTGLAILGSLYLLLAAEVEALKKIRSSKSTSLDIRQGLWVNGDIVGSPLQSPIDSFPPGELVSGRITETSRSAGGPGANYAQRDQPSERLCANCGHYHKQGEDDRRSRIPGMGIRGRVARLIIVFDDYLDSVKQEIFGHLEPVHEEPAVIDVPGQELRVPRRGTDASRSHSRAPSVNRSPAPETPVEGSSNANRTGSPRPQQSSRSPSPLPGATTPRRSTTGNLPAKDASFGLQESAGSSSTAALANVRRSRGDSLQVPATFH